MPVRRILARGEIAIYFRTCVNISIRILALLHVMKNSILEDTMIITTQWFLSQGNLFSRVLCNWQISNSGSWFRTWIADVKSAWKWQMFIIRIFMTIIARFTRNNHRPLSRMLQHSRWYFLSFGTFCSLVLFSSTLMSFFYMQTGKFQMRHTLAYLSTYISTLLCPLNCKYKRYGAFNRWRRECDKIMIFSNSS